MLSWIAPWERGREKRQGTAGESIKEQEVGVKYVSILKPSKPKWKTRCCNKTKPVDRNMAKVKKWRKAALYGKRLETYCL